MAGDATLPGAPKCVKRHTSDHHAGRLTGVRTGVAAAGSVAAVPAPLDADAVRTALTGTRFADVRVVAETGSTNADVRDLARAGEPEGVVVVAEHQTAGRGRLDRTWTAPAGASLLLSILSRPGSSLGLAADQLFLVSCAVGVASAEAARDASGADVRLKWPNDLVVDHDGGSRKLSGILAEAVLAGDQVEALVVGIGVNVNWPVELPADLASIAIALNHLAGQDLDRDALLASFLRSFDRWYTELATPAGQTRLRTRYRELSATLGRRIRVELDGETIVGDAVDLTLDGHLLVVDDCPDRPREITAGDVVHVRPAG